MAPHGERCCSNPRPPVQITVTLSTELQGQMGDVRGELRWSFAVNELASERLTSKVRSLKFNKLRQLSFA